MKRCMLFQGISGGTVAGNEVCTDYYVCCRLDVYEDNEEEEEE